VNIRYDTAKKPAYFVEYLQIYWKYRYTGSIIAIFSPHESALRADDGSVSYFLIYAGTLP